MPQNLGFLFAAFAITWIGFFAYLAFVQRMLKELRDRLSVLEREDDLDAD